MKTIIDFANKVKSLVDGRMSNIANVEKSPSTHAYAVGKQLIFNGLLCKATSAIAVGDTLAVGTNLALSDNVVEQIYSLNQGLTNSLDEIADMNNVLGAKNFINVTSKTSTYNGLTFTINADNSVTVNGTATVQSYFTLSNENAWDLKAGNYIINGCPSGGSASTFELQIRTDESDSSLWIFGIDFGNGANFNIASDKKVKAYIGVQSGVTVTNKTFYPMLRPASITDDTYVPYSMTNREMTPYVQAISNPNLLDNPWFTVNQRGQSSYTIVGAYSVDRWKASIDDTNLSCTISINSDNSLTVSAPASNMWFFQLGPIIDLELLKGKTITLSVDATASDNNSGRLYSSFFANNRWDEFDATNIPAGRHITSLTFTIPSSFDYPVEDYTSFGINIYSNKSITIHSTKLEIGSVSTLHMDTAPNYQQELAKCQRYFQIIGKKGTNGNGLQVTIGMPYSTSNIWFPMYLPVPMIKTPTIEQITGDWIVTQIGSGSPTLLNPDIDIVNFGDVNVSNINLGINSTNAFTLNSSYKLATKAGTNDSRIFLSADL